MGRLIDADKLKESIDNCDICNICPDKDVRCSYDCGFPDALDYKWEKLIDAQPTIDAPTWIPCSERLPEDIRPVLVTWKNNDPASYYQYIVGKHFIGAAHYHRGKWYWYSSVTEDLLSEYGKCDFEEFDEAIEVVAWMPLPEPWKGADDE